MIWSQDPTQADFRSPDTSNRYEHLQIVALIQRSRGIMGADELKCFRPDNMSELIRATIISNINHGENANVKCEGRNVVRMKK